MKKLSLNLVFTFCIFLAYAQTSLESFYGINHWMPYTIGSQTYGGYVNYSPIQNLVRNAGTRWYRIGGNSYDGHGYDVSTMANSYQIYTSAIASIRAVNSNAQILVQLPFKPNVNSPNTITPSDFATMVTNITTAYPDVLYFAIGNEWDFYKDGNGDPKYSYNEIADNIRDYALAMKSANPSIKIVAPALTRFGAVDKNNDPIMQELIGGADDITGPISCSCPANGKFYIDVVDFHNYGGSWGDMTNDVYDNTTYLSHRNGLIDYPHNNFTDDINDLESLMDGANTTHSRTGVDALTMAITEMNICYNIPTDPNGTDPWNNIGIGIGPRSFFAGQYWADMFTVLMNQATTSGNNKFEFVMPWSIHEHGGDGDIDGNGQDLGMTFDAASTTVAPKPLSTYWHYSTIVHYMSIGYFYQGYCFRNTTGYPSLTDVKACMTYNNSANEGTIMIMNQSGVGHWYMIRLNGSTPFNARPLMDLISIDASINKFYRVFMPANTTKWLRLNGCYDVVQWITYSQSGYVNDPANYQPIARWVNTIPCLACSAEFDEEDIYENTNLEGHLRYETINMKGSLTVLDGDTLIIDSSEVVMDQDTKINVERGGTLIIRDSQIHGCDGNTWSGINIQGKIDQNVTFIAERNYFADGYPTINADSVKNFTVTNCYFKNADNAIILTRSKIFTIDENVFDSVLYGVYTSECYTSTLTASSISNNSFGFNETAISFDKDNHSNLDILCNSFDYEDYAIYSSGTTLKDQGSSSIGAGNMFLSESTLDANQFWHDGDTIIYYYGPNESVSLDPTKTHIDIEEASDDRECGFWLRPGNQVAIKNQSTNFSLFPNPTNSAVTLNYKLEEGSVGEWQLSNMMGQVVNTIMITAQNSSTIIDISKLPTGIYISTVEADGMKVRTDKLVISR
jgi:hypothetical protein